MDPDTNLQKQLTIANQIQYIHDSETWLFDDPEDEQAELASLGVELSELVLTLHEWISKGGFLPTQWHPNLYHPKSPSTMTMKEMIDETLERR